MPLKRLLRDPFKRILFELGAGYYARKLATGPEADIRREFVCSLNRRIEERELRRLLTDAGLVSLTLEQRLGGMVWFGQGTVPARD